MLRKRLDTQWAKPRKRVEVQSRQFITRVWCGAEFVGSWSRTRVTFPANPCHISSQASLLTRVCGRLTARNIGSASKVGATKDSGLHRIKSSGCSQPETSLHLNRWTRRFDGPVRLTNRATPKQTSNQFARAPVLTRLTGTTLIKLWTSQQAWRSSRLAAWG